MPFYLHAKSAEVNPETDQAFLTRTDAMCAFDPSVHKVTFIPSNDDRLAFRQRELDRFASGEYIQVPWDSYTYLYPDHYAHLSVKTPGLIAYTKSIENGVHDRQTCTRPGRYLQEYYRDHLTSDQIAKFIAACDSTHLELKIARTPGDIRRVYIGGPRSCMSHWGSSRECPQCRKSGGAHYDYETYLDDIHPTEVYGNSDLAVAYYGDIDHASARTVVWPDKMIYSERSDGAMYGASDVLRGLLRNAGYTSGSLYGAKIRAVECRGTYVMPYVDNIYRAYVKQSDGKTWVELSEGYESGQYMECLSTNNTSGLGAEFDDAADDDYFTCDHCNERTHQDDYGGDGYCSNCYDDLFTRCEKCEEYTRITRIERSEDGNLYCRSCYSESVETCAICKNTFNTLEFSDSDTRTRERDNLESLCSDCANTHSYCTLCESCYEIPEKSPVVDDPNIYRAQCSECNRLIRPEGITSLFATPDYEAHCNKVFTDTHCNAFNGTPHVDIRIASDVPSVLLPVYRKANAVFPSISGPNDYYQFNYRHDPNVSYRFPYGPKITFESGSPELHALRDIGWRNLCAIADTVISQMAD